MKNIGNATPKALLKAAGKNTFKYLHSNFGFDFEKPFILESGNNSFTINKVWSIIPHHLYDYTVSVIVSGYTPYYCCVQILPGDFNIELPNKNVFEWKTRPETYFRKSDFNNDRKKSLDYFIIAQKKDYCLPVKQEQYGSYYFNDNDRYTNIKPSGSYSITFTDPQKQGKEIYYSIGRFIYGKPDDIKNNPVKWFDKSGYMTFIRKETLKAKAKKLKEEREKAKYLETDNTDKITKIKTAAEQSKQFIIEKLSNAKTYEEIKNITCILDWSFSWIMFDVELFEQRTNSKEYSSIEKSENAYNSIMNKINKMYDELSGKAGTEK